VGCWRSRYAKCDVPKLKQWQPEVVKYDAPKKLTFPDRLDRPSWVSDVDPLTGQVQGDRASQYEERFARALDKNENVQRFDFLPQYILPRGYGGGIQLDFMVHAGGLLYPIQIDGDWIHRSAEAKARDEFQDTVLNNYMMQHSITTIPIERILGSLLETQDEADYEVGIRW